MAFGGSIPAKGTDANSNSVTELHGRPLTSRLRLPEEVVLMSAACASAEPVHLIGISTAGGRCLCPHNPARSTRQPQDCPGRLCITWHALRRLR